MTVKELKKKRREFLNETIGFFSSNPRCFVEDFCKYVARRDGKTIGCAIGRKIPDKKLCRRLDKGDFGWERVFPQLPDNLKILGSAFLKDVQLLHDINGLWVGGNSEGFIGLGLTKQGKDWVRNIRRIYC